MNILQILPPPIARRIIAVQRWMQANQFLFLLSVLGIAIIFLLINFFLAPLLPRPSTPPVLLSTYAEASIRVGDTVTKMQTALGKSTPINETDGRQRYDFPSKKNVNLIIQVWVAQQKVVEIYYPVTLEENVLSNQTVLPEDAPVEYWDANSPGQKIRLYPKSGFGFVFHNETKNITGLYQFQPDQVSSFLEHHPQFSSNETTQPRQPEAWDSSVFATPAPTTK